MKDGPNLTEIKTRVGVHGGRRSDHKLRIEVENSRSKVPRLPKTAFVESAWDPTGTHRMLGNSICRSPHKFIAGECELKAITS